MSSDYCSQDLRARVEQLKAAVAASQTTSKNAAERLPVLWDWANARAKSGHRIPPDLPLVVYFDETYRHLAQEVEDDDSLSSIERIKKGWSNDLSLNYILALADRFVKELHLREEDQSAFGHVTADTMTFSANSFTTGSGRS